MENADDAIRHALRVARRLGFVEVDLESGDVSFQAKLSPAAVAPARAATAEQADHVEAADRSTGEITATLVGYYQPAEVPLSVGQHVTKGQIVAVIAALGLANDIESVVSGEVTKVFVQDGQSVEYGQAIAEVKLSA